MKKYILVNATLLIAFLSFNSIQSNMHHKPCCDDEKPNGYPNPIHVYAKSLSPYKKPSYGYQKYEKPSYGYNKPSYEHKKSSYGYGKPSYEQEKTAYGYKKSSYDYKPSYKQAYPSNSYEKPSFGYKEPSLPKVGKQKKVKKCTRNKHCN